MKSIQTILLTDLFRVSLSSTSGHGKISVCYQREWREVGNVFTHEGGDV